MITAPLSSIERYIAFFSNNELPVLRRTARMMAELKEEEDSVSARRLAAVVLQDPLMALRLLAYLEAHRRSSQNHDVTTIDRAILMLGITPFFRKFSDLPTVEDFLGAHPKALVGVLRVIGRSRNASRWARDWALVRHDIEVDEITVAALLHEAAEILFWCFAPELMLRVTQLLHDTPGLRSAHAQHAMLKVAIGDVQVALTRAWGLPQLLVTLMDPANADSARVRNVILATDLARHTANGWADPALPDDYTGIAELLHNSVPMVLRRLNVPEEHWPAAARASQDDGGEGATAD
ncbi:MAG: HDOD domain-containing protein [Rhodocyclaceae bacterium]